MTSSLGGIADANVPRAVMTYTDQIGYGVMRAAANGTSTCCARSPLLAATMNRPVGACDAQPSRDLGYAAADMLISMISGKEAMPSLRLLPMHLIERTSLGSDVPDDG